MFFDPFLHADWAVQVHALTAVLAVPIGAVVLWRPKGTALHKALGRVWVGLMLVTATSALLINELRLVGPFSPIHIFSLVTYWSLGRGMWAILVEKNVKRHRGEMQGLFVYALLLAGAFTFLPGRRMHMLLFGPEAGWPEALVAIGLILGTAALLGWLWRPVRRAA